MSKMCLANHDQDKQTATISTLSLSGKTDRIPDFVGQNSYVSKIHCASCRCNTTIYQQKK